MSSSQTGQSQTAAKKKRVVGSSQAKKGISSQYSDLFTYKAPEVASKEIK
jgi:hypothetical protein